MHILQLCVSSHITAFRTISLQKLKHILFIRVFEDAQFLLSVGKLIDHQSFDVTEALDNFFLELGRFEFSNYFLNMLIFPLQV